MRGPSKLPLVGMCVWIYSEDGENRRPSIVMGFPRTNESKRTLSVNLIYALSDSLLSKGRDDRLFDVPHKDYRLDGNPFWEYAQLDDVKEILGDECIDGAL